MRKAALALALVLDIACRDSLWAPSGVERASVRSAGRFVVAASDSVVVGEPVAGPVSVLGCGYPPVGLSGSWAPTATELAVLEAALPAWLESHISSLDLPPDKSDVYVNRQYVGKYRAGRRVVLINAWHKDAGPGRGLMSDRLFMSCGGGPLNFRLLFDVADKSFSGYQGNGDI